MVGEDWTQGELVRAITALRQAVDHLTAKLDDDYMRKDVYGPKIDDLKNWQDWALRIVVGAVLLAVVGVVITASPR